MTKPICTIDISDVAKAGSVSQAIVAWAKESDTVASGVVGSTFATSGPGIGWTQNYGTAEYAERALSEGASAYIDESTGLVLHSVHVDDADDDAEILTDIGGCEYAVGEWSEESVVRLECPDEEDALANPKALGQMIEALVSHHSTRSDLWAWKVLVKKIEEAHEEIEANLVEFQDLVSQMP